ncbi:hypothetical protein B7P43_G16292 [Cryptotermes secundus]|uniref:Mos1 transposase HTH domain-containing protein n=1 Tax=Cryptotermes secundus TaxID=105785 RepID=A0A2J7R0G6_9NEOP|nr:hypothetical protein B7P43_G16292 [Cryptotermes secundus]
MPNPQVGDYRMSAVRSYHLHIEAFSSIRNLRTRHAIVTRGPRNMEHEDIACTMACRLQHSAHARTPSQHRYKMAAPLETCTREEQRSVIRFLCSEGVKPIEIYRRMKFQYGDACLSQQQVYEWSRKFANGVTSVEDAPRLGQAHRVVTPENTAAVEVIVRENRRVTLNEIAASLNIRGTPRGA